MKIEGPELEEAGAEMHRLMERLYPICRSITGDGVRETLRLVSEFVPFELHEVPTGTAVFDWVVPKEWNIRDAYIKRDGRRIVDFRESNLHVVSYSVPVHATMSLRELRSHLYTVPDHPDWIPYRTSYYNEEWGFCLRHSTLERMEEEGSYEVCIDSSLEDGHLTYGEHVIEGSSPDEVLISCHLCHPSLCNDNLSGIALTTKLAELLAGQELRYTYRFLLIPGTIGSITWLALNEDNVSRIRHGLVVNCVGDPGHMRYKRSRRGDAPIDRTAEHVLERSGQEHEVVDFIPYGYDERQYCSPGFDLPVGSLTRTSHGRFEEYHTSADDLDLVKAEYLADSLSKYLRVLNILERDSIYLNTNPKCEPQLGRRGLYKKVGGASGSPNRQMALLWTLNLSDGDHSLLDIAERSGLDFEEIESAAGELREHGLLVEADRDDRGA
jgi:aminopeptidase-like protein